VPVQICESILSLPQFCVAYPTLLMSSSQTPPLHASLRALTEACAETELVALSKRQRPPWTLATRAPLLHRLAAILLLQHKDAMTQTDGVTLHCRPICAG